MTVILKIRQSRINGIYRSHIVRVTETCVFVALLFDWIQMLQTRTGEKGERATAFAIIFHGNTPQKTRFSILGSSLSLRRPNPPPPIWSAGKGNVIAAALSTFFSFAYTPTTTGKEANMNCPPPPLTSPLPSHQTQPRSSSPNEGCTRPNERGGLVVRRGVWAKAGLLRFVAFLV